MSREDYPYGPFPLAKLGGNGYPDVLDNGYH